MGIEPKFVGDISQLMGEIAMATTHPVTCEI